MEEVPDTIDVRLITPLLNNLYWVHRDIVEAIAHAIPYRSDADIVWLASQLRDEAAEVPHYRSRLELIGFEPTEAIRIQDSKLRYQQLKETRSPIELAVGMNVVAQGTLGIIEHECLHRRFPAFLPFFPAIVVTMEQHLDSAVIFLRSQSDDAVRAEMSRLWDHLHLVTIPELTPLLQPIIERGIFPANIVEQSVDLFLTISEKLGISSDAFVRH